MAITFSKTLEMNGKLETGRWFFKFSLSKPDFFSKGLTTASLNLDGTEHSDIDLLMMSVIWGTNTELSHFLSRLVGNGSKQHVFDAEFDNIFKTSSQDVGSKIVKKWPSNGLSNAMTSVFPSLPSLTSLVRMSLILLLKCDPKSLGNSKSDVQSGRIGTLDSPSSELAILKTFPWFLQQEFILNKNQSCLLLRSSFVLSEHFYL